MIKNVYNIDVVCLFICVVVDACVVRMRDCVEGCFQSTPCLTQSTPWFSIQHQGNKNMSAFLGHTQSTHIHPFSHANTPCMQPPPPPHTWGRHCHPATTPVLHRNYHAAYETTYKTKALPLMIPKPLYLPASLSTIIIIVFHSPQCPNTMLSCTIPCFSTQCPTQCPPTSCIYHSYIMHVSLYTLTSPSRPTYIFSPLQCNLQCFQCLVRQAAWKQRHPLTRGFITEAHGDDTQVVCCVMLLGMLNLLVVKVWG